MENILESTQEELNKDDLFDEEWEAITSSKEKYTLTKNQALIVKQAMATGSRGNIVFDSFVICIPYITDFYRTRKFLKDTLTLSDKIPQDEGEYIPMSEEKFKKFKEETYKKIGKSMK